MSLHKNSKKNNPSSDGNMPLSGHLKELRNRLIICVIVLVVTFLIGLQFSGTIVEVLTAMGKPYGYNFVYLSPQELLLQYFQVAGVTAIVLSFPVIAYHVWAFISPGLKENENRMVFWTLVFGLVFFLLGVLFAYKIMLPFMLHFLVDLSHGTNVQASISIGNYLTFLLTIFIVLGCVFEMPVVCVLLDSIGILKVAWMKKFRKVMIVVIFFIAAIITPPDAVSQIMVAVPMLGLYELSVAVCTVIEKRKKERAAQEETAQENEEADEEDHEEA